MCVVGDALDVQPSPRGSFHAGKDSGPLCSSTRGIGATPLPKQCSRAVDGPLDAAGLLWMHAARDAQHHPFAAEARALCASRRLTTAVRASVVQQAPAWATGWARISTRPVACA